MLMAREALALALWSMTSEEEQRSFTSYVCHSFPNLYMFSPGKTSTKIKLSPLLKCFVNPLTFLNR